MCRALLPWGLLLWAGAWCVPAAGEAVDALEALGVGVKKDRQGRVTELVLSAGHGDDVPVTDECIYRVKGDRLAICFGTRHRPDRFATRKGDGLRLILYRRAAAEKK